MSMLGCWTPHILEFFRNGSSIGLLRVGIFHLQAGDIALVKVAIPSHRFDEAALLQLEVLLGCVCHLRFLLVLSVSQVPETTSPILNYIMYDMNP